MSTTGKIPPGPDHEKRILEPGRLTVNKRIRRYYYTDQGWRYVDYVVETPPYGQGSDRRLRVRDGAWVETKFLSDFGVVPEPSGGYNPVAYTVAL